jgi:hypothetical protein
MSMSLLHVRTAEAPGRVLGAGKARANSFKRAAHIVLLGASAVGAVMLTAVLWLAASAALDVG